MGESIADLVVSYLLVQEKARRTKAKYLELKDRPGCKAEAAMYCDLAQAFQDRAEGLRLRYQQIKLGDGSQQAQASNVMH